METTARVVNATLLPFAALLWAYGIKPVNPNDHTWPGVMALLIVWLLARLWRATDFERPYNCRTLKVLGCLCLLGVVERAVTFWL